MLAGIRLGRYAEAEATATERASLPANPFSAADPQDEWSRAQVARAHSVAKQGRSEEARKLVLAGLKRYRDEQEHGAGGVSFNRDLAYALYVVAITVQGDPASQARKVAVLNEGDPAAGLDAAFSVADAIGGMSDERQLRRILALPAGRALWQRGGSLADALSDHAALARLPSGSLGRAFLAFCQRHGIHSRALIQHQHAMSRDYTRLDPVRQWFFDRLVVMHDVIHVLAGYDASVAGESAR